MVKSDNISEAAVRVEIVDRLLRDLLNLPGRVETSTHTVDYLYGADGTKLSKTVALSGTHFETDTHYAGNLVFRLLDPESILVEGGYIDMTGSTPAYRFYVTDHQGNIRAVTDGSGTVLRTNHYDPYGEEVLPVLTSASTLPSSTAGTDAASRYLYGAKEWDGNLSLYDFSARWYNPVGSVSFTAMDPLCEKYYSLSPYAYCAGNPVNLVDPSGTYFTESSKPYVDDLREFSFNQIGLLLSSLSNYRSNLSDEQLSFWDRSFITTMIESIQRSILDYSQVITELFVMENSDQGYDVSISDDYNAGVADGFVRGGSGFNMKTGLFEMKVPVGGGLGLVAHELKHGYQFEIGEFSGSIKAHYDIEDEIEAYHRQALFGGGSFSADQIKAEYNYLGPRRIGLQEQIKAQGPQRVANRIKTPFRFNNKTYYPRVL